MVGTLLSHYRILEPLGAGGMGVVYRARDEHLEREVAIKLLPEASVREPSARARLRREALALSRLNHPHIATIYELDADSGTDFLVMELVMGPTLAERLAEGPLGEPEAARIGAGIAGALEAAHEQGVVHRDLKPANVVLTARGGPKVLDFGLARMLEESLEPSPHTTATGAATIVGTLPYMAPEQLLGAELDGRCDLYALGVVLYEMVTGQVPFQDRLATALIYQITSAAPVPPGRIRPDLSPRLEEIILKCLEKDPGLRYASARELKIDLERVRSGPAAAPGGPPGQAPAIRSIAVLPLDNLSGDPAQEFFADGMTEALIADLAQIRALRVISRTSVMQYKGARRPLPEIAQALRVDAIVEGSVLRAGGRVRITAQLIEAATDRHLWGHSYERDLGDVLALQSEVARAIAQEVRIQLSPAESARLAGDRIVQPEAHVAYLKGRFHWNRRTRAALETAVEYFEQAIALDPRFALAYSGLADAYNILSDLSVVSPEIAVRKAREAALKSLELDEAQAEAHTSLAYLEHFFEWNWAAADREYRRAIEINPAYATARQWYSLLLASLGKADESIAEARRALELDPLSMIIYTSVGDTCFFARRYDEAILHYKRALEMDPEYIPAQTDLARAYEQKGMFDEAMAWYRSAQERRTGMPQPSSGLVHAYALAGRREEALDIVEQMKRMSQERYVSPYSIGSIYACLGEKDLAFEWLDRAYQGHDHALVWIKVHPRIDTLRSDARYGDLLRKMGLTP